MPRNPILIKMLDRLHASLMRGPSLNCRPQSSRQRIDLNALTAFGDVDPGTILPSLLGDGKTCRIAAAIPMPPELAKEPFHSYGKPDDHEESSEEIRAWRRQKSLLTKLRNLGEDARTYEQDTGVHAMNIGYPVLSLPPGSMGGGSGRILAPIAFIPTTIEVQVSRKPGLSISCRGSGVDLVMPNPALLAWIEKQTGIVAEEPFDDQEGEHPWVEIDELIRHVAQALELELPDIETYTHTEDFSLDTVPKMENLPTAPTLLRSAVLGLFPASNQGLLSDTKAMLADEKLTGPVTSF
ncbi:MAG: DUF4011 domain-containing protein, partial [Planctomycetota bacterium]